MKPNDSSPTTAPGGSEPPGRSIAPPRWRIPFGIENAAASAVLILVALVPTAEIIARTVFGTGIYGGAELTTHLVLWITFLGGAITSREGRHITLQVGVDLIREPARTWILTVTSFLAATMATAMTWSALSLVLIGFDPSRTISFIPVQIAAAVLPVGFALMAVRFVTRAPGGTAQRIVAAAGVLLGTVLAFSSVMNVLYAVSPSLPAWLTDLEGALAGFSAAVALPLAAVLAASILFGTPIFVVLGGLAYLLFIRSGGSLEVIPNEAYTLLTGYSIPAIPLFTFAGFILSESKAGERLVRLFRAWLGWLPGGLVIMTVLVCTFFTTFTGATGVTILALGALLSFVLVKSSRYETRFSTGLITASGSIGLLFPPSLPIILYGVTAQINIKNMFVGGLLPGFLMVLALCVVGVITALRTRVELVPFRAREALLAVGGSFWELLLPVIILLGYFMGLTTLVETGAIAVLYSLVVEVLIHRDLRLSDLPRVFMKCIPIIGGVLIILAAAKGLSYYVVDAQVPMTLSAWAQNHIHSKYVFLILLNLALLVTGCLMDIFSAILVVVPLILPIGQLFGIHPVHLGVIFLANLGVGYLTPPVGLNLFLASYRFNEPLARIYRDVVPFFLVLLAVVLLITYVPWFSTGLLGVITF